MSKNSNSKTILKVAFLLTGFAILGCGQDKRQDKACLAPRDNDTDTGQDADADTDADADSDRDADTDSDADADSDADTDTDTHTNTDDTAEGSDSSDESDPNSDPPPPTDIDTDADTDTDLPLHLSLDHHGNTLHYRRSVEGLLTRHDEVACSAASFFGGYRGFDRHRQCHLGDLSALCHTVRRRQDALCRSNRQERIRR